MPVRPALAVLCALALVLAGCSSGTDSSGGEATGSGGGATASGDGQEDSGNGGEGSPTQSGATGNAGEGETAGGEQAALTLIVVETSLGTVLANGEGQTVYLFTPDKVGKRSVCTGPCTEVWIPVRTEGEPTAGDGVDASLIATIERPDGSKQITYKGHPLYTLVDDAQPGDVKGQSVGGVWFAVTPAGEQAG